MWRRSWIGAFPLSAARLAFRANLFGTLEAIMGTISPLQLPMQHAESIVAENDDPQLLNELRRLEGSKAKQKVAKACELAWPQRHRDFLRLWVALGPAGPVAGPRKVRLVQGSFSNGARLRSQR